MIKVEPFYSYKVLEENRSQFFSLFSKVFSRQYSDSEWERFFHKNPGGEPSGVSVYSDGELVAFSALLPSWIQSASGPISYGLYVAAMVHPDFRSGATTYLQMLAVLKDVASDVGHTFVMAFPNRNAFYPLRQLGRFTLLDSAEFRNGPIDDVYIDYLQRMGDAPFLTDKILDWRLKFPGLKMEKFVVTKQFQGRLNILDWLGQPSSFSDTDYDYPRWFSADHAYVDSEPRDVNLTYLEIEPGMIELSTLRRSVLYSDVY